MDGNRPFATVKINKGPELSFSYKIDSGAGKTFIRLQDAKALGLKLEETVSNGAGGEFKSHSTILNLISVADKVAVENMKVSVEDSPVEFLGADFLSQFIVTIDLQNEQIIFRPTH